MVQGQPRQIVFEIPITKTARTKWTGGVAQVIESLLYKWGNPEFKPHSHQKKKKKSLPVSTQEPIPKPPPYSELLVTAVLHSWFQNLYHFLWQL
jgi:hypothetical protein